VYYSGHGYWDTGNRVGYWVPVDGAKDDVANYISTSDITSQIGVINARQVLIVADACYSGVLVKTVADQLDRPSPDRAAWLNDRSQLRSRRVMSSGGTTQVMDGDGLGGRHSVFAGQFLAALRNRSGAFEAKELYRDIAPRVEQAARGVGQRQEPQYGVLERAAHAAGDFVFKPKG
jgi:uncharacterized protein